MQKSKEGVESTMIEIETTVCELMDKAHQEGLDQAWTAARWIFNASAQTLADVFGGVGNWDNLTALEAICKIATYEERKNKIEVGDEVKINADGIKAVVMDKSDNEDMWWLYTENGCIEEWQDVQFRKSGRRFPQIEEVLKAMQRGES